MCARHTVEQNIGLVSPAFCSTLFWHLLLCAFGFGCVHSSVFINRRRGQRLMTCVEHPCLLAPWRRSLTTTMPLCQRPLAVNIMSASCHLLIRTHWSLAALSSSTTRWAYTKLSYSPKITVLFESVSEYVLKVHAVSKFCRSVRMQISVW